MPTQVRILSPAFLKNISFIYDKLAKKSIELRKMALEDITLGKVEQEKLAKLVVKIVNDEQSKNPDKKVVFPEEDMLEKIKQYRFGNYNPEEVIREGMANLSPDDLIRKGIRREEKDGKLYFMRQAAYNG